MSLQDIAVAVKRVEAALRRRPEFSLHDDAPATARWESGTRVVASHADGMKMLTDLPREIGGSGDQVTPGWLFRAGLASCSATSIALAAATEGIELTVLEVRVSSRSDTRGLLGMTGDNGVPVYAGPGDMQLHVRIGATAISSERLRALVESGMRRSPMPNALQTATPLALHIDTDVN